MKRLILLRHGEAGFSDGVDFQRQLTSKGKSQLHNLGQHLILRELEVDRMYCSSATRTRETAEIIKSHISIKEEVYDKEIYSANLEILLKILENTPKGVETCLLIGHNPTISLMVSYLTSGDYVGLQPGMMAMLELEIPEWYMIGINTASLREILS
jgi:phosphohistidine phosphatase